MRLTFIVIIVAVLKTSRLPYGFMASKMSSSHSDRQHVSQAEWWEMLAALRRLPPADQDRVCHRIEELTGLKVGTVSSASFTHAFECNCCV